MQTDKQKIKEKIKNVDEQIELLKSLKNKLLGQLDDQQPSLNNNPVVEHVYKDSLDDKLRIYRSLFRGRKDVYAKLWISRKTGRTGYSPVCKNEWNKSLCKKFVIKCVECPNREYALLNDDVIKTHFSGKSVIGIYPLLQDENCNFLALDFDGKEWIEDVLAFKRTCSEEAIPIYIERSRSGNGAHVWIFFKEEAPAASARRMGSYLITKTMSNRYQLDMKSYDRLFPNQDTMPKGGFGNLIALPLQGESVKQENSVFIDENCAPIKDQWEYLSVIERIPAYRIEQIANEASRSGQITGVRMSPVEEDDSPWMWLPSGRRKYKPAIKNLPPDITLVVSDRIYIKTDSIPSVLLNQIKRIAAFQNPEFYRKQSMRLSTAITPRIISCSEIIDGYLCMPRGCIDDICYILNEYAIKHNIVDKRNSGKRVKFKFYGELSKNQASMLRQINKNDIGVFVAPPGIGKTVIALNSIAKQKTNALILVHRKPLMEQWKLQIASYFKMDLKKIGEIGAGKNKSTGIIDIAMLQSMEKKGVVDDRIADYGCIVVDECHHISAFSFEQVISKAKARYILGLTATPYRKDGHQPIIHMQCGPTSCLVKHKEMQNAEYVYKVIPQITGLEYEWNENSKISELWPVLFNNEERNNVIINDVLNAITQGRYPIIITERREHIKALESALNGKVDHLAVLYGGLGRKQRKEIIDKLNCIDNKSKAILATGSYIGEGFDDPRLDTLFLTMPISFKGKLVQYAGRLHRHHKNKKEIHIYDYVDSNVSVLANMYRKRLKTYKAMGYEIKSDS